MKHANSMSQHKRDLKKFTNNNKILSFWKQIACQRSAREWNTLSQLLHIIKLRRAISHHTLLLITLTINKLTMAMHVELKAGSSAIEKKMISALIVDAKHYFWIKFKSWRLYNLNINSIISHTLNRINYFWINSYGLITRVRKATFNRNWA